MSLLPYLHRVAAGSDLSGEEAHQAMGVLLEGGASEAEIAAFLVALKMKGETAAEVAGFARAMRDRMIVVDAGPDVIDTCGTGGDGAGTFNISTVAAIVMAGAGARVAKHGNRSISGSSGSADVLEALGVRVTLTPEEAARAIREIGIGFLFAPAMHPAMKHAQTVRRALKLRTVFNILGPLTNPAGASAQLIGAPSHASAKVMAEALAALGTRRAFVVHGQDGLDEVTIAGPTDVYEVTARGVGHRVWRASDFGLGEADVTSLKGGDTACNSKIALGILGGYPGAPRDIVLANAAAGLLAADLVDNLISGVESAARSIDSGAALHKLELLKENFPAG